MSPHPFHTSVFFLCSSVFFEILSSSMDHHSFFMFKFFRKLSSALISIIFLSHLVARTVLADPKFEPCVPRNCGNGLNISYPFWIPEEQHSYCGHPNFEITCEDKEPVLKISDDDYIIRDIFYSNHSFLVTNAWALNSTCPTPQHNLTLDRTPFNYSSAQVDLFFFYNCSSDPTEFPFYQVPCASNSSHYSFAVFVHEGALNLLNYSSEKCRESVSVPMDVDEGATYDSIVNMKYPDILKKGFVLEWTASNCSDCEESGGSCGFDNNQFLCFCRDRIHSRSCKDGKKPNIPKKLIIGFSTAGASVVITCLCFFIYRRCTNRRIPASSALLSRDLSYDPSSKTKTDLENGSTHLGVHIFTYDELEEATDNFHPSKELGDGGFGTVYHGKLRDGRVVAVKRLYENNFKRVEQFMNEVEILNRLRHPNLVTLYGCTSRHSRELLLVYEFIPNGTVADHLHGDLAKPGSLKWPTRMSIAIETASALTYLHASDVIHRDVKTNNILLDDSFHVKVADFGLSRLFPMDVTHISTAPQGTPGYVDPEYHQCYQLTDKSDVYSFGVVLVELISSKPAVDITRHRQEINLANMAIKRIQDHALHELVDPSLGFESDCSIKNKINLVAELAFRCLQQGKEMRPSMDEVLEILRGIECEDHQEEEQVDNQTNDIGLLNIPKPFSPDSVTDKWDSRSTTPNGSN